MNNVRINVQRPSTTTNAPATPLTPMFMLDGSSNRPGSSLGQVVTPAPKTVGAYLQTSTRQLIPDKQSDAEVYAQGASGSFQHRGSVTPCLAVDGRFLEPVIQKALEIHGLVGPNETKRPTAKVLYTFKARSIRELSVAKGDQVTIVKDINEKWIECEAKGRTGIVPRTYIEHNVNAFRVSFYTEFSHTVKHLTLGVAIWKSSCKIWL